jgi:hypothetical protein
MYKVFIIFIAIFGMFSFTDAADIPDTRGREFYLTFMPNFHSGWRDSYKNDSLYIFISSDRAVSGSIQYAGRENINRTVYFKIPAGGGEYRFAEWWRYLEQAGYSLGGEYQMGQNGYKEKGCFHIRTNADVSVYALNRARMTTDGAMIFPVDALGKEHIITSYYSNEIFRFDNGDTLNSLTPSQFSVVATENNTRVDFSLSAPAHGEKVASFSRTLNEGDTYLVQADTSSRGNNYDLTGSFVNANKPIAVFAGHQRSLIPNDYEGILVTRDHLFSQIPHTAVWGKTYVITPFPRPIMESSTGSDLYRIIASEDDTEIYFNDVYITSLNKGEMYENRLTNAMEIRGSKPILVSLFKKTALELDGVQRYGDPFFLIVPPKKQYLTEYHTYNLQARGLNADGGGDVYVQQFVTVIAPTLYANTIRMDGQSLSSSLFTEISGTCYSYAHLDVRDGSHKLTGKKPFGVYVCGYGDADSYGYVGGMRFDTNPEIIPSLTKDTSICKGESLNLEAFGSYDVTWADSLVAADDNKFLVTVFPDTTTTYSALLIDSLGCEHEKNVTVTVHEFDLKLSGDTKLCYGEEGYLISEGGVYYEWKENEFLDRTDTSHVKINPTETTEFFVKCVDENGCVDSASIVVEVHPQIFPEAGEDTGVCPGGSTELTASGGYTYQWDYDETLSCLDCQTTIASPLDGQWYYVTVIDEFGCAERDSVFVSIYDIPQFEILADNQICHGDSLEVQAVSTIGESYSYHWYPEELFYSPESSIAMTKRIYEETELYVVAENEFGCIERDTIFISFHETPEFEILADNLICYGDSTTVQALSMTDEEYSYHWYPEELFHSPDMEETEIKPIFKNTEVFLIAENKFGCRDTVSTLIEIEACSLEVSDVFFEPEIYCFEETKNTFVYTPSTSISIDSLKLIGRDKENFRYTSKNELPFNISPEIALEIEITFIPDYKSDYFAYIEVYSQLDTIYRINLNAEKLVGIAELDIKYLSANDDNPGVMPEFLISIDSDDFNDIKPEALDLNLLYTSASLFAQDTTFTIADDISNWDMDLQMNISPDALNISWDIELTGNTPLKSKTKLFKFKPIALLKQSTQYTFEVEGIIKNREFCSDVISASDTISMMYCADTLRAVVVYKKDYSLVINGSIIEQDLEIKATVPFDGHAKLSLFDIQGREMPIHSGHMNEGENIFIVPRDRLSGQMYILKFERGDVVLTRKVVVR